MPKFLKKYFWDVDFKTLDYKKDRIYILKRLLEYGNSRAISWAWKKYAKRDWREALKSREVSPMTKNFWRLLIDFKK